MDRSMIVAGEELHGFKIVKDLGIVSGVFNKGIGFGKQKYEVSALDDAIKEMADNAVKLGANAIICFRAQSVNETISNPAYFVYGSAVVAEPIV